MTTQFPSSPSDELAEEFIDMETVGVTILGLSVPQLLKVVEFYRMRTGDMDFERIDFFTKNL